LHGHLTWRQQRLLDELAPTHITVPSGSRLPVDYSGAAPVLAVRVQELFGSMTTPTVAGGRIPVVLHLLSPAGRPVQITRDLSGFWRNGYPEVKKELKGRYPKHAWPEDPLNAVPTSRTRPRQRR
ncbi:MAG TPA: ATP-dependent helicase C-terminal domain-containing protein, partial [Desulfosarcina sp.]|nr:ATP-dependent helicase C-terminal domain-containing protein [Desulfosarcina sp.]